MQTSFKVFVVGAAAVILLSGCSAVQSNSHTSRVHIYSSVKEMAADSALVVTGVVVEQRVARDIDEITDFTLSTFEVHEAGPAGELPQQQLVVRQIGSAEQGAPAPLLEIGGEYLLYLTGSGLEGELADHYYITGGNAGYYARSDGIAARSASPSEEIFVQVQPEEGENLPPEITLSEATN